MYFVWMGKRVEGQVWREDEEFSCGVGTGQEGDQRGGLAGDTNLGVPSIKKGLKTIT